MESRNKLFYQARVPQYVEITYPSFFVGDDEIREHMMFVATTPTKGAKLQIEFNASNIDSDARARPTPLPHGSKLRAVLTSLKDYELRRGQCERRSHRDYCERIARSRNSCWPYRGAWNFPLCLVRQLRAYNTRATSVSKMVHHHWI